MTVTDMQQSIRSQLNDLRALDRVVNSTEFLQCLKLDPNNSRLESAIVSGDLEAVREWMEGVISTEFCELSIRQLRSIASQLGIQAYTYLKKDELLIEIVQVKTNAFKFKQIEEHTGGMSPSTNGTKAVS